MAVDQTLYNMGVQGLGMGLQPFQSPYLQGVSQSLWNQANQNWGDVINPSIKNNAMATGGYGGSRQGIAQGVMADRLNQSVFNAMAPVYNTAYENWLNRGVQAGNAALQSDLGYGNLGVNQYGAETARELGLGNLGVNQYGAETQRQLGLGNLDLGQFNADTARQLGLGNLGLDTFKTEMQSLLGAGGLDIAAYEAQNRAATGAAGAAGQPIFTNPWASGLGAGLGMYSFGKSQGWW